METLDQLIRNTEFIVSKDKFVIFQSKVIYENAFAIIQTDKEITLVVKDTDLSKFNQTNIIVSDSNWRLITFEVELPFELVGFIAKVSGKLAEANIPIFVLSSFSTDHLLIKQNNLEDAIITLKQLGFSQK